MSDYTQVALGFSEFVGQLLTETFEATINAQQYQLSRYAELEAMADLPDEEFLIRYVDPQTVLNREIAYAGAPIARQMEVPASRQPLLLELTEEYEEQSVIFKNRLTNYGFDSLREVIDSMVVSEQKSQLRALLARMEQARLVVDSGEITAKLELNSVYQAPQSTDGETALPDASTVKSARLAMSTPLTTDVATANTTDVDPVKTPVDSTTDSGKVPVDSEPVKPSIDNLAMLDRSIYDGIKTLEDPLTKETTLLFDKEVLDKAVNTGTDGPVRITAKPLASSATSSVFSEVTIRFKTV